MEFFSQENGLFLKELIVVINIAVWAAVAREAYKTFFPKKLKRTEAAVLEHVEQVSAAPLAPAFNLANLDFVESETVNASPVTPMPTDAVTLAPMAPAPVAVAPVTLTAAPIAQTELPTLSEYCSSLGIALKRPKRAQFIQASHLDQVAQTYLDVPKPGHRTLILTDISTSRRTKTIVARASFKPEPFYAGVDVIGNFSRRSFRSQADLQIRLQDVVRGYDSVVWLMSPKDSWHFNDIAPTRDRSSVGEFREMAH